MAAPRKRAPRKAAPAPTAPPEPAVQAGDGVGPVRIGERPAAAVEMVTLFSIDDVDYQIPARAEPQRGLRFIREAQDPRVGFDRALTALTWDLIGEANLRALEESPKTTREDLAQIFAVVRRLLLGGPSVLEEAATSGNS